MCPLVPRGCRYRRRRDRSAGCYDARAYDPARYAGRARGPRAAGPRGRAARGWRHGSVREKTGKTRPVLATRVRSSIRSCFAVPPPRCGRRHPAGAGPRGGPGVPGAVVRAAVLGRCRELPVGSWDPRGRGGARTQGSERGER